MKGPLLALTNVSVKRNDKLILQNINLVIRPGEVHFLIGPNGSGKTTLAHAVLGDPTHELVSGSIEFLGENISALAPEERARRGLYLGFQHPAELPGVAMMTFLRSALSARGDTVTPADVFTASAEFHLSKMGLHRGFLERPLNEGFSGGEKKRAEIAQLTFFNPLVALLDEFDSGLDVDGVKAALDAIDSYMNGERGLLIITHTPARIAQFLKPDYVHLLLAGTIAASGSDEMIAAIEEKGFEAFAAAHRI